MVNHAEHVINIIKQFMNVIEQLINELDETYFEHDRNLSHMPSFFCNFQKLLTTLKLLHFPVLFKSLTLHLKQLLQRA